MSEHTHDHDHDLDSACSVAHSPVAPAVRASTVRAGGSGDRALVAVFAAINLFSWNGHLWFQWPSLAILLVFIIRATRVYR